MTSPRPPWDFEYKLVSPGYPAGEDGAESDVVVALEEPATERQLSAALGGAPDAQVETLLVRPPIYWYRLRLGQAMALDGVVAALGRSGLAVRYAASAVRGSLALGEPLETRSAPPARATAWPTFPARTHHEPRSSGRWLFHEPGGIAVDRSVCGTGAGVRLAVVDDEGMSTDVLALEREVLVGTAAPSRSSLHGSLMVAWAVGVRGSEEQGLPPFAGVAPDTSARLYLIPKPGYDIVSLPCAIVRAVDDGADVVVCATYVEGTTSPLLDDALAFASKLGRGGKGTPVILPTGREVSSPPGSMHASLTLGFGDPASDPRVLCVAPSGRDGGWFLWKDRRGKLRPFANRGPAVRVAAPGDDMSYPFTRTERLGHAESSGASAIAAGVALLVLATNPDLSVADLYALLTSSASREEVVPSGIPADSADVLPRTRDRDGHDAKSGYGRLSARRACMCAADPVARLLVEMGEEEAAHEYLARTEGRVELPFRYSSALARFGALAVGRDPLLSHALLAVLRHLRLTSSDSGRGRSQPARSLARQLALVADRLSWQDPPGAISTELATLRKLGIEASRDGRLAEALETWCSMVARGLWPTTRETGSRQPPGSRHLRNDSRPTRSTP